MATPIQRNHIYGLQQWFLTHHSQVGYAQHRPMLTANLYEQDLVNLFAKAGKITPDCSEMVTLICRLAGLKSPSGPSFPYSSGDGNSTSMWEYLPHYVDVAGSHVGAIAAFGERGDQHVAMVMEPREDPILFSHGGPNGPIQVTLSALKQSMGNPLVTMLDISRL